MQQPVKSINTKVDLTVDATSYMGIADYGKMMIGDRGLEWYADKNVQKYIQIPWGEVTFVEVTVMFKGKYIPRFTVHTKTSSSFPFATRDPKRTLRAIRVYVDPKNLVQSRTFLKILGGYLRNIKARYFSKDKQAKD
ncbi:MULTISPECIES: DUF956 family protein [Lacticaseibacillus]|uniref:DUF956 family protein n=1 Tax=Lacticaseibacillus hegangensis TaxID=2486010 RepID=A0ABW4CYQ8_9LACO|nr:MULTISPECIES: DUF956 family protein [Lacticaseibacillus]